MTEGGAPDGSDLAPVSVRLGTVVPPEDPEDWTRPLTWVAAIGMLAAPLLALAWFWASPPASSVAPELGTYAVALGLAIGGAAVGSTQIGRLRAGTGTLGATLFAALLAVAIGAATAGERQLGAASPTLAHALAAAVAGVAGSLPAAMLNAWVAPWPSRLRRATVTAAAGALVAALVVPRLFSA